MLLKIGSRGDNVAEMQTKLGLKADGVFGLATSARVKKWQEENGLSADGILGPQSWAKMFDREVSDAGAGDDSTNIQVGECHLAALQGAIPKDVIKQIPDVAARFDIATPLRLAHFLAQCAHESGNFTVTQENLSYSADGLRKIFGKYFPGDLADSYVRQPEKIASRVYANRMGNGDEASKEGYLYRGRGYIQLTGKTNYASFNKIGIDDVMAAPDLVASKYPLLSAGWFWQERRINIAADRGADDTAILAVTKRVNGGTIGLDDRIKRFKKLYARLTG